MPMGRRGHSAGDPRQQLRQQRRERSGCRTKCLRVVVFLVNILTLILGASIGAIGVYRRFNPLPSTGSWSGAGAGNGHGADGSGSTAGGYTLIGAEKLWPPRNVLILCSVVVCLVSLCGAWGACCAKRDKNGHPALLFYYATLLMVSAFSLWVAIFCVMFSANADAYIEHYWRYLKHTMPKNVAQNEWIEMTSDAFSTAGVLGVFVSVLLLVGMYSSARLMGLRYLTRGMLTWLNGTSAMGGLCIAAGGLVVLNQNVGGAWLAALVIGLGVFIFVLCILGMLAAMKESPGLLLMFFVCMGIIVMGLIGCISAAYYFADADWVESQWDTLKGKVYPVTLTELKDIVDQHFGLLGAACTIVTILLLFNMWASMYLRHRIVRSGRGFNPLTPLSDDTAWNISDDAHEDDEDEDEEGRDYDEERIVPRLTNKSSLSAKDMMKMIELEERGARP